MKPQTGETTVARVTVPYFEKHICEIVKEQSLSILKRYEDSLRQARVQSQFSCEECSPPLMEGCISMLSPGFVTPCPIETPVSRLWLVSSLTIKLFLDL